MGFLSEIIGVLRQKYMKPGKCSTIKNSHNMAVVGEIRDKIAQLQYSYNRIIFLAGGGAAASKAIKKISDELSIPIVNISLMLSSTLKDITPKEREDILPDILQRAIIDENNREVILLDHMEILFEPSLNHDPFVLLEKISRMRTLLVHFPGNFDGTCLTWSTPEYRDYIRHKVPEGLVIKI